MRQASSRRPERGYQKGEARRQLILNAAKTILIKSGYHNLSVRRVAAKAGVSVGNLQYYFPTKRALTDAMLDEVIEQYLVEFENLRQEGPPEEQFKNIIRLIFTDLQDPQTTVFFPEIWSLANHQSGVTEQVDAMYARYRSVLSDLVTAINPDLSPERARQLAVFFSSSIEGHTMFVGHGKPMADELDTYIDMAIDSFLHLIHKG